MKAIDTSLQLGYTPVKVMFVWKIKFVWFSTSVYECGGTQVNCVVMRGLNEDEIINFVEKTRNQWVNHQKIVFVKSQKSTF